jgi:hypothetical protein
VSTFMSSATGSQLNKNPIQATTNTQCVVGPTTGYFGIHQSGTGFLGACPHGHVAITIVDTSIDCGYNRDDNSCYQDDECANADAYGGTVQMNSVGTVCCPAAFGGGNTFLSPNLCSCGGKQHTSPTPQQQQPPPPTPPAGQQPTPAANGDMSAACIQQCGQDCTCFDACCVCQPGQSSSVICNSVFNGVPVTQCRCAGAALTPAPQPVATPGLDSCTSACNECTCANSCCTQQCGGRVATHNCVALNGAITVRTFLPLASCFEK